MMHDRNQARQTTASRRLGLLGVLLFALLLGACSLGRAEPLTEIPSWIPIAPGSSAELLHGESKKGRRRGAVLASSTEDVESVRAFYQTSFESAGLSFETVPYETGEGNVLLTAESDDGRRGLTVTLEADGSGSRMVLQFVEAT